MPGKVNPIICESVLQASLKVIGNDAVITQTTKDEDITLRTYLIKHHVLPEATVNLILNPRQVTKPAVPGKS